MRTSDDISKLVEAELRRIRDVEAEMKMRAMMVRPYPIERDWEYGKAGDQITCWMVAEDVDAGIAIAYSEHGFGPGKPWGVVPLSGYEMGHDWFRSLEDAVKRSIG